jgi:hypothetical protein
MHSAFSYAGRSGASRQNAGLIGPLIIRPLKRLVAPCRLTDWPVPYWPPPSGARKMLPLPLSAPVVSTVTAGARYAATSYRRRRERACCGDRRWTGVTSAIRRFTYGRNQRCEPFTWTKPAGEILARAIRNETSLT